jgi:hypothetical protein
MTEFQYEQVLNNLALIIQDPHALPWHLSIKTGTSQVADTGTAGLAPGIVILNNSEPFLTGSRAIVDQWGTTPVTDDTALRLLRLAYQKAIRPTPGLSLSEVNDLAHTLSNQIGTNSDISIYGEMTRYSLADVVATERAKERNDVEFQVVKAIEELKKEGQAETNKATEKQKKEQATPKPGTQLEPLETQPTTRRPTDIDKLLGLLRTPENPVGEIRQTIGLMNYNFLNTTDTDIYVSDPNGKKPHIPVSSLPDVDSVFALGGKPFNLHVIPYDAEEKQLREEGKGEINVSGVTMLHFRVFDGNGKRVVDHDDSHYYPRKAEQIEFLKTLIDPEGPGGLSRRSDRERFINTVMSIVSDDLPIASKIPTGLARETIRQVDDIENTLESIDEKLARGWFHVGSKWEVPQNACYRGHCGKVYVWVNADGREGLAEFTLAILKLASAFKDPQVITAPSGIQFSPALSQQR